MIDRCIQRIRSIDARAEALSEADRDDILLINLQHAVQASIDLAAHVKARVVV